MQAAWVLQHEPSAAKRADNEARALACAAQEDLGVRDLVALNALVGNESLGNVSGINRCLTIAYKGYDLAEHPPIRVE